MLYLSGWIGESRIRRRTPVDSTTTGSRRKPRECNWRSSSQRRRQLGTWWVVELLHTYYRIFVVSSSARREMFVVRFFGTAIQPFPQWQQELIAFVLQRRPPPSPPSRENDQKRYCICIYTCVSKKKRHTPVSRMYIRTLRKRSERHILSRPGKWIAPLQNPELSPELDKGGEHKKSASCRD